MGASVREPVRLESPARQRLVAYRRRLDERLGCTGKALRLGSIPKKRRFPLAPDSQEKVESRFLLSSCFRTFVFS